MLTRWGNVDLGIGALDELRHQMDQLLENVERRPEAQVWGKQQSTGPRATMQDQGDEIVLWAEVPGLSEKEVNLTLTQDVLTVKGKREVQLPEKYSVHRQERPSYEFSRSYTLPTKVDPEHALATVRHGLLTVTLRKAPESKPRQITVKAN